MNLWLAFNSRRHTLTILFQDNHRKIQKPLVLLKFIHRVLIQFRWNKVDLSMSGISLFSNYPMISYAVFTWQSMEFNHYVTFYLSAYKPQKLMHTLLNHCKWSKVSSVAEWFLVNIQFILSTHVNHSGNSKEPNNVAVYNVLNAWTHSVLCACSSVCVCV